MRILGVAVVASVVVACIAPEASAGLSDDRVIEIARGTAEARELHSKFGTSEASVDRSGRLAVDFRAGPARLRVFIVNGIAVEPFLDCPAGTVHTRDVVLAIRSCG